MNKVTVAALAALALVVVPAASADSGKGKSGREHKTQDHSGKAKSEIEQTGQELSDEGTPESDETTEEQSGKGKTGTKKLKGQSGKCKRPRRVGFVAAGTVTTLDASSLTLTVSKANRHATNWLALNAPTFATAGARLHLKGIVDSTGDGLVDYADVLSTDRVRVIGKLIRPKRGCTGETVVSLRRIHVRRKSADTEPDVEPIEEEPVVEPVE